MSTTNNSVSLPTMMNAVVCDEFGPVENLLVKSLAVPTPNADEVLIQVHAAGVNFPDSLLVQGLYQMKPERPFTPGNEVAGTIVAVGENVNHLNVGMRVIGLSMLGGFAQYVTCKMTHVMPLPEEIKFDQAAGLITAHATAHHALVQRAQIQPGETILVTGAAGGTGIAAVQIAKKLGATVIAACSTPEKLDFAVNQGADHTINYTEQNIKEEVNRITHKRGVDVVYECVGGDIFNQCSKSMAWNGRLLVVGFAGGVIPQFPVNLALVKGYSVVGVFWGSFTMHEPKVFQQNMKELFGWLINGDVTVHVDKHYALADTSAALNDLNHRKAKGKLIVIP